MKINFTITERNGKKALWADDRCIWDLTASELTEDVQGAIINAFYIGLDCAKEEINRIDFGCQATLKFKEVKKK